MSTPDTRHAILIVARAMVQARGYNALSFREIAKAVGIKSASIHYHFPTKGDLGAALARAYTDEAIAAMEGLVASGASPSACVAGYAAIYRAALEAENRMCLCGIMAAEHEDLPPAVRVEVQRFADAAITWLARLQRAGTDLSAEAAHQRALGIYAAIGGAQLMARGRNDPAVFDAAMAAYRTAGLLP